MVVGDGVAPGGGLVIDGNGEDLEAGVAIFSIQVNVAAVFDAAGRAPGGPEINEHVAAAEIGKGEGSAGGRGAGEGRREGPQAGEVFRVWVSHLRGRSVWFGGSCLP